MKFIFCLILTTSFIFASPSFAQNAPFSMAGEGKEGEVLSSPICSKLINRSDQTILGTLTTASQTLENGQIAEFSDNFRLNSGDEKKFCTSGPFFEGRRLELVLRTLIPLFECKTKIDRNIFLDAIEDENGFKKLSATCF